MRLDQAMLARRLAASRARARELILGGHVAVDGRVVTKPAKAVAEDTVVSLDGEAHRFVSRAALKLAHGLDAFDVDPRAKCCLDIGASTGGFTEVLLQRGATRVHAIDVGTGQLHPRLRADHRVVSREGLNARDLSTLDVPDPVNLVVCDVSFISLRKVMPAALALAAPQAELVTLVKPQFELGPEAIGKNGRVLTAPDRQRAFIDAEIVPFFANLGWRASQVVESPIRGGEGTLEFLLHAQTPAT